GPGAGAVQRLRQGWHVSGRLLLGSRRGRPGPVATAGTRICGGRRTGAVASESGLADEGGPSGPLRRVQRAKSNVAFCPSTANVNVTWVTLPGARRKPAYPSPAVDVRTRMPRSDAADVPPRVMVAPVRSTLLM